MKTDANGGVSHCTCTAPQTRRYLAKISGLLLDRIDIHIEVPRLSSDELMSKRSGESSAGVRRRVVAAREKQTARMKELGVTCNAGTGPKAMGAFCEMDAGNQRVAQSGDCAVQPVWARV